MCNENMRLKEVRKSLGLSQEAFGNRIGVGKAAISSIETGKNSFTDHMRKSICREYNINEDWLKTGKGEMLISDSTDELIDKYNLDTFGASLVREYMKLSDNQKAAVQDFFYSVSDRNKQDIFPST